MIEQPRRSHSSPTLGPTAFSAFYAEHAERVLIFLARRCLDPEAAVDLMAETFAQAFASRRQFRGTSEEEVAAWVFGIARNELSDYFRRGKAEQKAVRRLGLSIPLLDGDDYTRIEELADLGEARRELAEQLARLSAEQRDAVRLRVIDECSYEDVARQLGVSENTARARVSRGLRQLAATVDRNVLAKGA